MSERDPRDVPQTQPLDASPAVPDDPYGSPPAATESGRVTDSPQPHPSWAIPSVADSPAERPALPEAPAAGAGPSPVPVGPVLGAAAVGPSPGPAGANASRFTRRRAGIVAAGAGAAVLLVAAGFLAGTQFGDRHDTTRLLSAQGQDGSEGGQGYGWGDRDGDGQGPGGSGQFPGGQLPGGPDGDGDGDGPFGHGGQGDAAVRFVTVGRISAINGSTLTLSTVQGATAKVMLTSATTINGTAGGSAGALTVGQVVFVAGAQTSDGSYQATAIMTRPVRRADPGSGSDGGPGAQGQPGRQGQPGQPGQQGQQGQNAALGSADTQVT